MDRVLNFDKNEKLGRDSKKPERKEEENSAMARIRLEPQEFRPCIDLLGALATDMTFNELL